MGEKTSDEILSESTQPIFSPEFKHTPKKGLYLSCIKNCEISNFWLFYCFFFFWGGAFNMGVNGEL